MAKDYSLYKYYNGSDNYPTKKAAFFGEYERIFESTYNGSAANKLEAFRDFIRETLYEQASDIYHFGAPGIDEDKCFNEYFKIYLEPEYKTDLYEGN